ncbi:hypothetical protein [Cupriavidus necator]|uniref:hypothetical protein n=1 Tax=Cupriavidus necator TaxID=106590 RepID=UPI0005B423B0|nr:hypothetical protein [Cupriavidus necator]
MPIDFRALLDPARIREAEAIRAEQERVQAARDARMRAALAALGHAEVASRLNEAESRFVRQATARWYSSGYLTEAQTNWVMDLAGRNSLILLDPAGTYVLHDVNGYIVRSESRSGGSMVVVPDVDTLVEHAKDASWSDRDIGAIQQRWGGRQNQATHVGRFRFGAAGQASTEDSLCRQERQRA